MALRWNPEVNMSKEEIDYFLDGRGLIARLSTIGNHGFPNVAPVWYYWNRESIFFDLGVKRANSRNLRSTFFLLIEVPSCLCFKTRVRTLGFHKICCLTFQIIKSAQCLVAIN